MNKQSFLAVVQFDVSTTTFDAEPNDGSNDILFNHMFVTFCFVPPILLPIRRNGRIKSGEAPGLGLGVNH